MGGHLVRKVGGPLEMDSQRDKEMSLLGTELPRVDSPRASNKISRHPDLRLGCHDQRAQPSLPRFLSVLTKVHGD